MAASALAICCVSKMHAPIPTVSLCERRRDTTTHAVSDCQWTQEVWKELVSPAFSSLKKRLSHMMQDSLVYFQI